MKHISKLLVIIFLSFLSIGKMFPQDSLLSKPEIKNYIQFLEKESRKWTEKELLNQPLDYIKKIASLSYQAYDKDYIGMRRYMKSRKELIGTLPTINKILGEKVTTLLKVRYLLEMKINSIKTVQFHSCSGSAYPRVEINAKILDIIKGSNNFKPGESITFYFSPDLRETNYNFMQDEIVFGGITTTDDCNGITDFLFY